MRRTIAVTVGLLLASTAYAAVRTFTLAGAALTASAPTATNCEGAAMSATCGVPLDKGRGWRACMSAPAANTITSGRLSAYLYDYTVDRWARAAELDLTVGAAGFRDYCWPSAPVSNPNGRLFFAPTGVVLVGGGTAVDVRVEVTF